MIRRGGRVSGAQAVATWASGLPRNKEGPDEDERSRTEHIAVAIAYDAALATLRTVEVRGFDGYAITARLLSWAAMRLAAAPLDKPGAVNPIAAFGLGPLRDACAAAGLSVTYV
ncbi:MAG: hypothetical protein JOY80_09400 [Candidatus Dormibacteraeota bacterium]|nr:hypothetical protein [Candidatus Dormibacteraeota bacterium]